MDASRHLVVGLGNPGPDYAATRHNAGAMVLDTLAAMQPAGGDRFRSHRGRAQVAETRLGTPPGVPVVLAKPAGYMNTSGGPVAALRSYFAVPVERVVVVHDELDLPFGTVRLKLGGGDNGHNGLRSVTSSLGSRDYLRVRIGVGRPPGRQDPAVFVLKPFSTIERRELPLVLAEAADAVRLLVTEGLEAAQNVVHRPA